MKTLYESILDDEEMIYKNAEEQAIRAAFENCIVKFDKNDIIITPGKGYPRAICKNIPGKHKIIVKDIGILSIRSGVDGDTVKRIVSDDYDMMLEFSDEWQVGGTPPPKKTVFKNCEIKMGSIRVFYPIEFQNCTFNLSGKCIDLCYDIADIKDLRKFKVDAQKYNGVYIDVYQTPLGDDMYKHYDNDDKYWEKIDKELNNIFKALIQKGRRCAIRYEKDRSREYSPHSKCWVNSYGYVNV